MTFAPKGFVASQGYCRYHPPATVRPMSAYSSNSATAMPLRMIVVACVVVALTAGCGGAPTASDQPAYMASPLSPLEGGSSRSLASFSGTPVVINIWAPWCAPCVREMPDFEKVHRHFGERVAIVGVTDGLDKAGSKRLAKSTGVTYPLLIDDEGNLQTDLGVVNLPTTVFLDTEGRVVGRHAGALTEDRLIAKIESLYDIS